MDIKRLATAGIVLTFLLSACGGMTTQKHVINHTSNEHPYYLDKHSDKMGKQILSGNLKDPTVSSKITNLWTNYIPSPHSY